MQKEPYIVLRTVSALAPDPFFKMSPSEAFPGGEGLHDYAGGAPILPRHLRTFSGLASARGDHFSTFSSLKTDLDELSAKDAARVLRQSDVIAVAPSFPLKLVAPVQVSNVTTGLASRAATWGVDAVGATGSAFDGNGAVVAVLDTGIDDAHPAFKGVTLVRRDFTASGLADTNGHGTHCAGTIFGRAVNGTRIGVAPGVSRALIGKVLGPGGGSSSAIVDAILWAANEGANVISMSLGMDFPGYVQMQVSRGIPPNLATTRALTGYRLNVLLFERLAGYLESLQQSAGGACLLVAAAGNESARYASPSIEIETSPPAISTGFISVAALQNQPGGGLIPADFSNTGVNLSAPGVDILSAEANTTGLISMNGTSMATPHVAGVAALWAQQLSRQNMLTSFSLRARLTGTCDTTQLAPGFDPLDVGLGMVRSP